MEMGAGSSPGGSISDPTVCQYARESEEDNPTIRALSFTWKIKEELLASGLRLAQPQAGKAAIW